MTPSVFNNQIGRSGFVFVTELFHHRVPFSFLLLLCCWDENGNVITCSVQNERLKGLEENQSFFVRSQRVRDETQDRKMKDLNHLNSYVSARRRLSPPVCTQSLVFCATDQAHFAVQDLR